MTVIHELQHGVSAPMRDVAVKASPLQGPDADDNDDDDGGPTPIPQVKFQDPVLQKSAHRKLLANTSANFLGLGAGFTGPQGTFQIPFDPPDPNISVGATQIVETVNLAWAVFDKATGTPLLGPVSLASIWTGFNTACSSTALLGIVDPVVLYDKQAQRWVMEVVTLGSQQLSCFAVSTTSDATGTYNLYAFEIKASGFGATPRFGVWSDAYYLAIRRYRPYPTYLGPYACAIDRTQMLIGATANMLCFQISNTSIDGMLSSDLDGTSPPPPGSPNYYLVQGPAGSNSLYLYKFHVDFTTPSNSTFTGPTIIPVAPYTAAPKGAIVAQLGTTQTLTGIGNCIMHRLAYRYFADAPTPYEALVATHTVLVGQGSGRHVSLRWYEIHNPGTIPTIFQQGTYSPDNTSRWMASIAMDKNSNIAIGYSASSASIYPEIRMAGRLSTDPPGTLAAELTLFTSSGAQDGSNRWGDFTSMSIDPTDDCTFWYTNQYNVASGQLEWATRVFPFRFPNCQ